MEYRTRMEYRSRGQFEVLTRVVLDSLKWAGVIGVAWNLLKPGGWLLSIVNTIAENQPMSVYYLVLGVIAVFSCKVWLDNVHPRAFSRLLGFAWALAGVFSILRLLQPL
jgi:hypothetical protein